MADYGGPQGFGGTTPGGPNTGGALGGTSAGSGYGGGYSTPGGGPHGTYQEPALGLDAYGDLSGTTESEKDFVDRMNEQGEDLKDSDIRSLYGTLTEKDINTRTVSVKNLGKFAKNAITRNVTTTNPQGDVLGYFGEVPSLGMSGILSRLAGIDMKGLVLGPELSGEEPGGGRPDTASPVYYQDIADTILEETPIEEIPFEGYNPYYTEYATYANGGIASLPANFNPMTGANPFRMMMHGGRV